MNKIAKLTKLGLSRETIRVLSAHEVRRVHGGVLNTWNSCGSRNTDEMGACYPTCVCTLETEDISNCCQVP